VALAPDAEGADIDEGHLGVAVVAFGQGREEVVQFRQEDRIIMIRLPVGPIRIDALTGTEVISFGPGLLDPLGRGTPQERLAARDTQRDLLSFVERGPVELSFLRLQVRPGKGR
jgi:hypothetical protein